MQTNDATDGASPPLTFHERRELVKLIRERVTQLDESDESLRDLRAAFISRYEAELQNWRDRRGRFHAMFLIVTVGTGALGVVSAGLAAATRQGKSAVVTITLVAVGIVVAAMAAVTQVYSPQRRYFEYKRDEANLRRLGWRYLRELEEGEKPEVAYARFRSGANEILDTEHLSAGES